MKYPVIHYQGTEIELSPGIELKIEECNPDFEYSPHTKLEFKCSDEAGKILMTTTDNLIDEITVRTLTEQEANDYIADKEQQDAVKYQRKSGLCFFRLNRNPIEITYQEGNEQRTIALGEFGRINICKADYVDGIGKNEPLCSIESSHSPYENHRITVYWRGEWERESISVEAAAGLLERLTKEHSIMLENGACYLPEKQRTQKDSYELE